MTEQKKTQADLEQSRKEAEAANRAKSDFLANMSHELRTPMNGIIGLSDILLDADMPDAQREMVEAVSSSARNLLVLLNDILDYSKVESGQLVLESIPFDMRDVVRQTVFLHAAHAQAKGLALHSAVSDNVPACLVGDPARLQQIMNNLLGNAIKFTDAGHVRLDVGGAIHVKSGKFRLKISVEDTGIGIPENRQQAVFAKFTQADVSTSRKFGGTGLGLTITRDLARLMGGEVSLKSVEGAGTTFYVEVPAGVGDISQPVPAKTGICARVARRAEQKAWLSGTDCRLLVVDDHPVNRLFMRKALTNMGVSHFDEATDGRSALALFASNRYDVIFMDCQMPDMDGFSVAKIIREEESLRKGHRTAIIAVTANAMVEDEKKCLAAGMDDYISKPVDREKLRRVLERWLSPEQTVPDRPVAVTPAVMPPARDDTVVMDWGRLDEVTDGDAVMKLRVIEMFTHHAGNDIEILAQGLSGGNAAQWTDTAHKLYGAAVNMGAYAMAYACDAAQKMEDAPPPHRHAAYDRIVRSYHEVCAALKNAG